MSRCVVWDVLISPLSLSLHSSGWGGKQSVPSPVAHNGEEFLASNRLAAGGRTNHFCSVSCEIKRLLIVFINQYDQSSAVENLELHQILGQNWTGVKSGAVIMATSFVTEVWSLKSSILMSTCLNPAQHSRKPAFHHGLKEMFRLPFCLAVLVTGASTRSSRVENGS